MCVCVLGGGGVDVCVWWWWWWRCRSVGGGGGEWKSISHRQRRVFVHTSRRTLSQAMPPPHTCHTPQPADSMAHNAPIPHPPLPKIGLSPPPQFCFCLLCSVVHTNPLPSWTATRGRTVVARQLTAMCQGNIRNCCRRWLSSPPPPL